MSTVIASCSRGLPNLPSQIVPLAGTGHPGDLVVARVSAVGAYPRVELPSGREARIRIGDEIIGVLAERHSSTSIYGGIPDQGLQVQPGAQADLLAVGGVIGLARSSPSTLGTPTRLELLGLACDASRPDQPLRLQPQAALEVPDVPVVLVGGTAAEVGKTTFATALVHHLTTSYGLKVGVTKLAGTGRMRDLLTLADAGAVCGADFVDAGLATTYGRDEQTVTGAARFLIGKLAAEGAELIVAELGGDLWGAGIPAILHDPALSRIARGLVLVPSDSMASLGVDLWVRTNQISIPTVHAVPHRNVMAARERLGRGLGVDPVDPQNRDDLDRLCANLLSDLTMPRATA